MTVIKVKDLEPNPFRDIKTYPIDREKVEALKTSITETEFWDNLVARPHPKKKGRFQIAYGAHRLTVLKELKILEIDIPIRDLDDATMIRIMANENMEDWKTNAGVVVETVSAAKEFLDAELTKCTWKTLNKSIKSLFEDSRGFENAKHQGVGQTILLKFLGGNWKQWMIQRARELMRDAEEGILDPKAAQTFLNLDQANKFRQLVREKKVSLQGQVQLAQQLSEKWNRPKYSSLKTDSKKNKRKSRELPKDQAEVRRTLSESLSTARQLIPRIDWSAEPNDKLLKRIRDHATELTPILSRFPSKPD